MTTLVSTSLIGLEEVQRAALVQLFDNLNSEIAKMEEFFYQRDLDFFTRMGRDASEVTRIELEQVAPENFYTGHVPSLIEAPITSYPNVAALCTLATPAAGSESIDQGSAYRNVLYVEIMAKSEVDAQEANSRALRMAEAAHRCIMRDQTLGGIVNGFEGDPSGQPGDVFVRKEKTGYGQRWFWQGVRLEYAVRKEAVNPPSSTGSVLRTGIPEGLGIDQA